MSFTLNWREPLPLPLHLASVIKVSSFRDYVINVLKGLRKQIKVWYVRLQVWKSDKIKIPDGVVTNDVTSSVTRWHAKGCKQVS